MAHERNRALLADVLAHPEDDAPRLVYGDWWSERGDPRGELVILQCEASRKNPREEEDLRNRLRCASRDGIDLEEAEGAAAERIESLMEANRKAWTAGLAGPVAGAMHGFHRGFVEAVAIDAADLLQRAATIFDAEPVRIVRIRKLTPETVEDFFASPFLARVRSLSFSAPAPEYVFQALASSSRLEALEVLDLHDLKPTRSVALRIAALDNLPSLRRLEIRTKWTRGGLPADCGEKLDARWGEVLWGW
jgi:uncharacterized protein (TIGR02996 family)